MTSSRLIGIAKSPKCRRWRKIESSSYWNGHYIAEIDKYSSTYLSSSANARIPMIQPFQFGLSSCGIESISKVTIQMLQEHPEYVLFRGDIHNALNSALRKTIFQEIQSNLPSLCPWVYCLYGNSSDLWTKDVNGVYFSIPVKKESSREKHWVSQPRHVLISLPNYQYLS